MDLGVAIIIVIPLTASLVGILNFLFTRYNHAHEKGVNDGLIRQELIHIRTSLEKINKAVDDYLPRIVSVEQSVASAHHRINDIQDVLKQKGGN